MARLDASLLHEVGLGRLPMEEQETMLAAVVDHLRLRIGERLAAGMTREQLDAIDACTDAGDEEGSLAVLRAARPDYQRVADEEFEALKDELRAGAPAILAAHGIPIADHA